MFRGHGTYAADGKLIASVAGVVERVNKLIYVKPLKSRSDSQVPYLEHESILFYIYITI